ncbi:MAG TPA: hypothetical protein VLV17_05565 [Anaeromyxobacteraceae bacterium]|nr:hypothetical protein [Anaeromyxobacteraceae bacterium]
MRSLKRVPLLAITLLSATVAEAGPGLPIGHDDAIYPEDLLLASKARKVAVVITEHGPEPRDIPVTRTEKVEIEVRRESAESCRFGVAVAGYGPARPVRADRPVSIVLLTLGRGDLHLTCPAEDEAVARKADSR